MTKGKIVLVPFPFDDLSGTKVRPAVCLSEPIGPHRHVVLSFITSTIPSDRVATDMVIESTHPDFRLTGLRRSSTLRLHRLMTVSTSVIRRELGELSSGLTAELEQRLRAVFGLPG